MGQDKQATLMVVDASEKVLVSWARDIFTFGTLALTTWFVNTLVPPSGWVNFILSICWFLWVLGKANRHRVVMTADQARAWLDERYPNQTENTHD